MSHQEKASRCSCETPAHEFKDDVSYIHFKFPVNYSFHEQSRPTRELEPPITLLTAPECLSVTLKIPIRSINSELLSHLQSRQTKRKMKTINSKSRKNIKGVKQKKHRSTTLLRTRVQQRSSASSDSIFWNLQGPLHLLNTSQVKNPKGKFTIKVRFRGSRWQQRCREIFGQKDFWKQLS